MYRLIRDHNKKLMALFAVFLMVAFLMPAGLQQMNNPANHARARMGDNQPITVGDFQRARQDWDILQRETITTTVTGQPVPLLAMLGEPSMQQLAALQNPQLAQFQQITPAPILIVRDPETFLLLWKEAQQAGVTISDDRLDTVMATELRALRGDPATVSRVREAVRDYLMVEASYARVAGMAKASAPERQRALTRALARVSIDVATFSAAPAGVPTTAAATAVGPTREQLQAQFDKYADLPAGAPSESNPFGYGYRLPDAVKLQTISLERNQLRAVVEKTRTPRQWEVEARKYFYSHPGEFPATPTTTPAPAASAFDLSAPATSQPAQAGYDVLSAEQKKQALDRVLDPEIAQLTTRITSYLNDRFAKDYAAAAPATQPMATTTAPTSASAFTSYGYVEQIARDVQQQFGVLPSVANLADWVTRQRITTLPGIGSASTSSNEDAATLAFGSQFFSGASTALHLQQFSRALTDYSGGVHLFRLTDVQRSQRAPSLDAVLAQVTADVQRQLATDAAKGAAAALVDAAKSSDLKVAAAAAGRAVTSVGPLNLNDQYSPIVGLDLQAGDRTTFMKELGTLLGSPLRDKLGRPLGTIVLPAARQVLAVNVTASSIDPTVGSEYHNELAAGISEVGQLTSIVQLDWFNFDSVAKRIDYKGDRPDRSGDAAPRAAGMK